MKIPNPSRSAANTSLRRLFRRRRPGRILTTPVVLALKTARRRRRSKMPAPIENRPPEQRRIRLRILLQILFLVSESFLVQFDSLSFPPRGRRGCCCYSFRRCYSLARNFGGTFATVRFRILRFVPTFSLSLRCFRGLLQGAMWGTFRLSRLLITSFLHLSFKYTTMISSFASSESSSRLSSSSRVRVVLFVRFARKNTKVWGEKRIYELKRCHNSKR